MENYKYQGLFNEDSLVHYRPSQDSSAQGSAHHKYDNQILARWIIMEVT